MLKRDSEPPEDKCEAVEKALRESEKRFRYLAEAAFEGIIIHARGVLITGNDQAFAMFGYTPSELLGRDVLHLCIAKESVETVIHKIRTKDIGPYEVIGVRKDGSKFPVEIRAREINWDGRKARVAALMDITERKRAEEALRQANQELERRVEERTEELVEAISRLKASQKELHRLSSKILTAQENERRRIAHELHDSIGQTLSAIKFKLNYALDKMNSESIQEAQDLWKELLPIVQDSIEEVRYISEGLRPPVLDDLGILATFNWFCAELSKIYTDIHFDQNHRIEEHQVPETLKIVLYRVLQESLHNVVQHSRADHVAISLTRVDGQLTLQIKDNGQGFDASQSATPADPHRGLGLGTMKERVNLSGGDFSVVSGLGNGTKVTARWHSPNPADESI